jgi:hypothetical protein
MSVADAATGRRSEQTFLEIRTEMATAAAERGNFRDHED